MSAPEDGGQAFPLHYDVPGKKGMTLRDWFAGMAMQGLIAHYGDRMHIVEEDSRISLHRAAYEHAEAMIEKRKS